jgi:hypothetical protein
MGAFVAADTGVGMVGSALCSLLHPLTTRAIPNVRTTSNRTMSEAGPPEPAAPHVQASAFPYSASRRLHAFSAWGSL